MLALKCIGQREYLQGTMPHQFVEAFNHATAIRDCFVILIEKPSNLKTKPILTVLYKQHHTKNDLIGITPQGGVGR